mgnify:CR=1 FL=1
MKGTKHKPDQIIAKLREADAMLNGGQSIGEVCQKLAISYRGGWRRVKIQADSAD